MSVKGVFASNHGITGARVGDFASGLLHAGTAGTAPLLALSTGMKSRPATDTVIHWFEQNKLTGRIKVTNNAASGKTLAVDDASQVIVGMIFRSEDTGEYFFVEAVTGSDLTVTRGFGGTTVTALDGSSTNKPIQRIGTAFEEGSSKPTAYVNLGYPRWNYVQIFRNAWDVTGTAKAIKWHTGNQVALNKQEAALYHAEDIERSSLWGRAAAGSLNGRPFRTMDGIITQIKTNVQAQSTNVSWAGDMRPFLQGIFEKNIKGQPNERIAFSGNSVVATLEDMARKDSQIQLNIAENQFGFEIMKMRTPFGTVMLMTHPLFVESPLWTKDLLVLHPAAITYRWLRPTDEDNYDKDGTRAGVDSDYGIIQSELSVEYQAEVTGGYFTGIDTAAASP